MMLDVCSDFSTTKNMYWFEQSINSFIYKCSEGILCVFQYVYLNCEITYILKSNV